MNDAKRNNTKGDKFHWEEFMFGAFLAAALTTIFYISAYPGMFEGIEIFSNDTIELRRIQTSGIYRPIYVRYKVQKGEEENKYEKEKVFLKRNFLATERLKRKKMELIIDELLGKYNPPPQ